MILAIILLLFVMTGLVLFLVRQTQRSRQLATLAMRDELTGIPNRRSILEFARLQLRLHLEGGAPFCLALIDLDRFKSINDMHGHATGDAALVAFAKTCQQELRAQDRLGRMGGEEFLVVMPATGIEQVAPLFERLREAVRVMPVPGLPSDRQITFSMGVAAARGLADDVESLVKAADQALYRGKEEGRDRLVIAT